MPLDLGGKVTRYILWFWNGGGLIEGFTNISKIDTLYYSQNHSGLLTEWSKGWWFHHPVQMVGFFKEIN